MLNLIQTMKIGAQVESNHTDLKTYITWKKIRTILISDKTSVRNFKRPKFLQFSLKL